MVAYELVEGDTPQHGPECPCPSCVGKLNQARNYVDTNLLRTKPEKALIPFIMHLRMLEKKTIPLELAGRPEIISSEGDLGPWGEKVYRELEDGR